MALCGGRSPSSPSPTTPPVRSSNRQEWWRVRCAEPPVRNSREGQNSVKVTNAIREPRTVTTWVRHVPLMPRSGPGITHRRLAWLFGKKRKPTSDAWIRAMAPLAVVEGVAPADVGRVAWLLAQPDAATATTASDDTASTRRISQKIRRRHARSARRARGSFRNTDQAKGLSPASFRLICPEGRAGDVQSARDG
jgi:hypothetical protein